MSSICRHITEKTFGIMIGDDDSVIPCRMVPAHPFRRGHPPAGADFHGMEMRFKKAAHFVPSFAVSPQKDGNGAAVPVLRCVGCRQISTANSAIRAGMSALSADTDSTRFVSVLSESSLSFSMKEASLSVSLPPIFSVESTKMSVMS